VTAGFHGKKTGTGFYRHGRLANTPNTAVLPQPAEDRSLELAVRRTIARLLTASFAAVGTGLIRNSDDLDALLVGAGWPAFRGGPIRYAHRRGLPTLVRACEDLERRFGPRFAVGKELQRRAGEPRLITIPFPRRALAA
jgi:hypothetical protein